MRLKSVIRSPKTITTPPPPLVSTSAKVMSLLCLFRCFFVVDCGRAVLASLDEELSEFPEASVPTAGSCLLFCGERKKTAV